MGLPHYANWSSIRLRNNAPISAQEAFFFKKKVVGPTEMGCTPLLNRSVIKEARETIEENHNASHSNEASLYKGKIKIKKVGGKLKITYAIVC